MKKKPKKSEEQELRFDAIVDFEMDEMEAKAYKIAILWQEISRKVFPDYNHTFMKKGDPRKSLVFKLCYKLARETKGIIQDNEYHLYVRAQLEVLKHIINNAKGVVLVDPSCLVGEKAWVRWKLWKKKYDTVIQKPVENTNNFSHPGAMKALLGIEQTKQFLTKNLGENPSLEKYKEIKTNNNIFRWVNLGKISPYYLAISPFIAKIFTADDFKKINFDVNLYLPCVTEQVLKKFKEIFPNEDLK